MEECFICSDNFPLYQALYQEGMCKECYDEYMYNGFMLTDEQYVKINNKKEITR